MGDGAADGTARGEEKNGNVGVDLRDDGEGYIEVGIESFEGDIGAEGAVFPFVAKAERSYRAGLSFSHKHDRVEDAGNGG